MKRIAVLFSGQGSQYVGMAKRLFDDCSETKGYFSTASKTLNLDMEELMFNSDSVLLSQTENTQPALMLHAVCAYRHYFKNGLVPRFLAGHSLGELSALVVADAMSLEDGLKLARARGLAMSESTNLASKVKPDDLGMNAVTKLDVITLEKICAQYADYGKDFVIANYNGNRQAVISGKKTCFSKIKDEVIANGGELIPLKVSSAFHSPFMQAATETFSVALKEVTFQKPKITVVANVTGLPYSSADEISSSLTKQMTSAVQWVSTLKWLDREGVDIFLEAGPKSVLKKLALSNLPERMAFSLDEESDASPIQSCLSADLTVIRQRPSYLGSCLAAAVATKNSNFDEGKYQTGVIDNYKAIQSLQEKVDSGEIELDEQHMKSALSLLKTIFDTKGTSETEQKRRFKLIGDKAGAKKIVESFGQSHFLEQSV